MLLKHLYRLKNSEEIEIGHVFQSRAFFHPKWNLHPSCISSSSGLLQRAPVTIIWRIVPFKNRTIKISYFFIFQACENFEIHRYIKENLHNFNKFFSFYFSPISPPTEMLKRYMCDYNLTMKFPPDLHNFAALNNLVNS